MENNEVKVLHRLNKDMQTLLSDFNVVIADVSALTALIYDREIVKCDEELDIKLRSHM